MYLEFENVKTAHNGTKGFEESGRYILQDNKVRIIVSVYQEMLKTKPSKTRKTKNDVLRTQR